MAAESRKKEGTGRAAPVLPSAPLQTFTQLSACSSLNQRSHSVVVAVSYRTKSAGAEEFDTTINPRQRKASAAGDMSEHRETLQPPVTGNGGDENGDGTSVTPDQVASVKADATRSKTGIVAATNHEHIYALREIVKPSVTVRQGEEKEVNECAPSPIGSPRIITSKLVRSSCGVYKKLEETTSGTVLCEQRTDDETLFGNRVDSFDSSENRAPLAIAAVPFSSVQKQLECPEATSSNGCDRRTSPSHDGKQKPPAADRKNKRRRALRLMSQLSNLIHLKHLENGSGKKRLRRRKPGTKPVMVITDDVIDWSASCHALDGLKKSSEPRIIVRKSRTTPDSFDEDEQFDVQENVTEDRSIGGLIYSDKVVINNSLSPGESFCRILCSRCSCS